MSFNLTDYLKTQTQASTGSVVDDTGKTTIKPASDTGSVSIETADGTVAIKADSTDKTVTIFETSKVNAIKDNIVDGDASNSLALATVLATLNFVKTYVAGQVSGALETKVFSSKSGYDTFLSGIQDGNYLVSVSDTTPFNYTINGTAYTNLTYMMLVIEKPTGSGANIQKAFVSSDFTIDATTVINLINSDPNWHLITTSDKNKLANVPSNTTSELAGKVSTSDSLYLSIPQNLPSILNSKLEATSQVILDILSKLNNDVVLKTDSKYNNLPANTQAEINTINSTKANLSSPTFTGTLRAGTSIFTGTTTIQSLSMNGSLTSSSSANFSGNITASSFTGKVNCTFSNYAYIQLTYMDTSSDANYCQYYGTTNVVNAGSVATATPRGWSGRAMVFRVLRNSARGWLWENSTGELVADLNSFTKIFNVEGGINIAGNRVIDVRDVASSSTDTSTKLATIGQVNTIASQGSNVRECIHYNDVPTPTTGSTSYIAQNWRNNTVIFFAAGAFTYTMPQMTTSSNPSSTQIKVPCYININNSNSGSDILLNLPTTDRRLYIDNVNNIAADQTKIVISAAKTYLLVAGVRTSGETWWLLKTLG